MDTTFNNALARMLRDTLSSLNETGSNGEAANVVDGLFAIARALEHVALALMAQDRESQEAS